MTCPEGYTEENLISGRGTAKIYSTGDGHCLKFTDQFGEDRCTQFRVIVVTDPPTHKYRPPARPPQTGPITIHCAAKLSAQCNDKVRFVTALRPLMDLGLSFKVPGQLFSDFAVAVL